MAHENRLRDAEMLGKECSAQLVGVYAAGFIQPSPGAGNMGIKDGTVRCEDDAVLFGMSAKGDCLKLQHRETEKGHAKETLVPVGHKDTPDTMDTVALIQLIFQIDHRVVPDGLIHVGFLIICF